MNWCWIFTLALVLIIAILIYLFFEKVVKTPYGKLNPIVALILIFLRIVRNENKLDYKKMRKEAEFNGKISQGKKPKLYDIEEIIMPETQGKLKARIYRPNNKEDNAVIVFYHGGGWAVCSLDTHDVLCRYLALKSNCTLVSVDYRLAPENKFPTAINDAYDALIWINNNPKIIKADSSRIAVCGDSAGGNLSAAVSIMARDKGFNKIKCQVLLYPAVDMVHLDTPSYKMFAKGYGLLVKEMELFKEYYFSKPEDMYSPFASPMLCNDHKNLPSTYIVTAQFDVLRDEAEVYANVLKNAGNDVVLKRYDGMFHGFMCVGGLIKKAWIANEEVADYIKSKV